MIQDVDAAVPLGLASAEDTIKILLSEQSPKRAEALRRDVARDLKWAVAEMRGEQYRGDVALQARIEAVRRALSDAVPRSSSDGHTPS